MYESKRSGFHKTDTDSYKAYSEIQNGFESVLNSEQIDFKVIYSNSVKEHPSDPRQTVHELDIGYRLPYKTKTGLDKSMDVYLHFQIYLYDNNCGRPELNCYYDIN